MICDNIMPFKINACILNVNQYNLKWVKQKIDLIKKNLNMKYNIHYGYKWKKRPLTLLLLYFMLYRFNVMFNLNYLILSIRNSN